MAEAVLNWLLIAVVAVAALGAAGHAIVYKRESRSAALWVILIGLLPPFGPLLYLLLGVNRVQRRAAVLRRARVRHRADPGHGPAEPDPHFAPIARLVGGLVDRPVVPGNALEPLVGGAEAYPAMLEAIESARRSIGLASYIFDGKGAIGAQFVEALGRAAGRGVAVRVLIDDVDARFSFSSAAKPLRRAGVTVGIFNPTLVPARLHAVNLRNHRKILVVDSALGFTGGMNVAEPYWNPRRPQLAYTDLHFRVRGPVVAQLSEVFVDDWQFATGEALRGEPWFAPIPAAGETLARAIEAGPDETFERIRWALVAALGAAKRSVRLCTPYFLPDQALISALDAAALRGVEVDILLPEVSDLPHVHWATYAQLWQVLEHGCRVWLRPGTFDHSKLLVVDAGWTLLGSSNWDARSLRLNFELDIECYGDRFGASMDAMLRARLAQARRLTLADVNGRPVPIKLRDGIARLFAPFL